MKNKHAEKLYKRAKEHLKKKTSRKLTDGKYLVYHSYYDENGKLYHDKGHWDDVGVVQGSIFNIIFWTHPRYMFAEEIRSKKRMSGSHSSHIFVSSTSYITCSSTENI